MFYFKVFLFVLWVILATGCSTPIAEYKDASPKLALNEFFQGRLEAYGMVQNYKGKVTRRFKAEIIGNWEGDTGILDERFVYDNGEIQYRCWHLQKSDNQYTGTASDVVGHATGETQGNALNWRYILQVPVKGKLRNIRLNDWLYLIDEKHLINRATMTYFGIPVGEITLSINKVDELDTTPLSKSCSL